MSRLPLLLLCALLLVSCSHRPSPELRRMLRQFSITADAAIGARDPETLKEQLDALGPQWPELIRALPTQDWHHQEFNDLTTMQARLGDAYVATFDGGMANPKVQEKLSEAGKLYRSAFATLDAEMRE